MAGVCSLIAGFETGVHTYTSTGQ